MTSFLQTSRQELYTHFSSPPSLDIFTKFLSALFHRSNDTWKKHKLSRGFDQPLVPCCVSDPILWNGPYSYIKDAMFPHVLRNSIVVWRCIILWNGSKERLITVLHSTMETSKKTFLCCVQFIYESPNGYWRSS